MKAASEALKNQEQPLLPEEKKDNLEDKVKLLEEQRSKKKKKDKK